MAFKKLAIGNDHTAIDPKNEIEAHILAIGNNSVAMVIGRMGAAFVAANAITSVTQQLSTVVDRLANELASTMGASQTIDPGRQLQLISVGVLICCVPLIILYCFTQRTLVESLAMTGSKE